MSRQPFEQIVIEHGPVVLRVCQGLVGAADAEDAWSETFLSALRAYPDLRHDSSIRGWLVTIAHNRSIDLLRRRNRGPVPTADPLEQASWDHVDPGDDELTAALATLTPRQRAAVVHRYLADQSYADVARLLACSEPAARRSAADGIAALRRHRLVRERA